MNVEGGEYYEIKKLILSYQDKNVSFVIIPYYPSNIATHVVEMFTVRLENKSNKTFALFEDGSKVFIPNIYESKSEKE
jgi:hypothetical protein